MSQTDWSNWTGYNITLRPISPEKLLWHKEHSEIWDEIKARCFFRFLKWVSIETGYKIVRVSEGLDTTAAWLYNGKRYWYIRNGGLGTENGSHDNYEGHTIQMIQVPNDISMFGHKYIMNIMTVREFLLNH